MKRIILIALAVLCSASLCYAWGGDSPNSQAGSDWKSFSTTNTSGVYTLTAISNDIIPKGAAILGYQIMQTTKESNENVCTIYDGGVSSSDEVIGEAEAMQYQKAGDWYPYPKTLQKQIYVHQGPHTVVTMFFE